MNSMIAWDAWPSTINLRYLLRRWIFVVSSKQSLIYSIYSLLSVKQFSLNEIQASFSILLRYQSSFYLLPFEITNSNNRWPVVPIASIKVAHCWFSAWFINACFVCFENTTLELPEMPIIYLFSSISYVSMFSILCSAFIDQYKLNHFCIESQFRAKNWSSSRVRLYLDCNTGWRLRNLTVQFWLSFLKLCLACNNSLAISCNWATLVENPKTEFLIPSSE